jgi:ABC-type nitrate/sulfonate/bicarbonate transport system substrate-binding protein
MPIRQVAGGQIRPAFSLVAQPDVNSYDDLKGKLVGVSRLRSLASNLLTVILRKHGLGINDVRVISLQTTNNVYLVLDTKQIAAGMLSVPKGGWGQTSTS